MLEKSTIARPYAQAVFELARQENTVRQWSQNLALLARIVAERQLVALLSHPKVSRQQLLDIILDVAKAAGGDISGQTLNLVKLLLAAGRMQYLPVIASLFEGLCAGAQGKIDVAIISAYELDESQQRDLAVAIRARLGAEVAISASVDESLIGGAIIRAGDAVIDASLRGRLRALGNALA